MNQNDGVIDSEYSTAFPHYRKLQETEKRAQTIYLDSGPEEPNLSKYKGHSDCDCKNCYFRKSFFKRIRMALTGRKAI